MRRVLLRIAGVITGAMLCASVLVIDTAHAESVAEVYVPKHRLAEALLPVAQGVLGDEGHASVDPGRNALVLVGARQAIEQAITLLRRQDRVLPQLELRYRSFDFADWSRAGYAVVGDEPESSKGTPFAAARVRKRALTGERFSTRARDDFESAVRVTSGGEVFLSTGARVPLISRDLVGADLVGVAEGARGLRASPRLLSSGAVHLDLVLEDTQVDSSGRVDGVRSSTTLVVQPGELVAVGDLSGASRVTERPGRAWSSRRAQRERILLIEVRVLDDGPAAAPGR